MLEHQYYHCVDFPLNDEELNTQRSLWIQHWSLFRWLVVRCVLLPRVQGYAIRGCQRCLQSRIWRSILEKMAEGTRG